MSALGWLFSEIAFRGWEGLPDAAFCDERADRLRWWARPYDALLTASYRLGRWFYGRAA